ncbi:MAG TPA: hypothetical protein VGX68_08285, partial [Thermoanaerobaculia bacterium]|nr:hypothetical protein [Thermoanaerobaculia bacterium]
MMHPRAAGCAPAPKTAPPPGGDPAGRGAHHRAPQPNATYPTYQHREAALLWSRLRAGAACGHYRSRAAPLHTAASRRAISPISSRFCRISS